jgi:hypothetical protein
MAASSNYRYAVKWERERARRLEFSAVNGFRTFGLFAGSAILCAVAGLASPVSSPSVLAASGTREPALPDDPPINSQGQAPSADEIRARAEKLIANQHKDDQALEQYERVEQHIDRTAGSSPRVIEDKTYRVVPDGAGTMKIELRDGGKAVDAATYNREMQNLRDMLQTMSNPSDARAKAALAKRAKRQSDRYDFVDAAKTAFKIKWLGTSQWRGRGCDVFELDPNPDFRPHGLFQDALVHVVAKIWVDHETLQMARGEAQVTSDISFGGGILGKLYRGGVVYIEQAEMAPGIWLPTHMQYDFAGRKFLFSFEQHQSIDASHYRRVGPPSEALLLVQSELTNRKSFVVDP